MRRLLFLLLLLSIPVYAAEPTPETACCMDLLDGYPLLDKCDQYEMNKERCEPIVSEYNALVNSLDGPASFTPLLMVLAFLGLISWLLWIGFKKLKKL